MKPILALYAKPPTPGKTKSRLAAKIGDIPAAALAKAMLVDNLAISADLPEISMELWAPPDADIQQFGLEIPSNVSVRKQCGDDLGSRMAHTISDALERGAPSCIIIGSDCVTHTHETISRTSRLLGASDVVVQPAADGGFVLIAATCTLDPILLNQTWGHAHVMKSLRQRISRMTQQPAEQRSTENRRHALTLAELPMTHDVDLLQDLEHARAWVQTNRPHGAVAAWFDNQ